MNLNTALELLLPQTHFHGQVAFSNTFHIQRILPRVTQELHHDAERVVGGSNARCSYLVQESQTLVYVLFLRTNVKERVVHDFVCEALETLKLLHHAQSTINATVATVPFTNVE